MKFFILAMISLLFNLYFLQNSQSREKLEYIIYSHTTHTCQTAKDSSIWVKNKTIFIRFLLENIKSKTTADCACTSALLRVSTKNAMNGELISRQIVINEAKYNTIQIKDREYKKLQIDISCHIN